MSFRPRLVQNSDHKSESYEGALLGILDPGAIAIEVFGEVLHFGALFAYLYRRFGPPNYNGDDHKEIAAYTLTTPLDDVFLNISIKAQTDTKFLFRYLVSQDIAREIGREARQPMEAWKQAFEAWGATQKADMASWKVRTELAQRFIVETGTELPEATRRHSEGSLGHRCEEALRATMKDLMRPVLVRDVPIDATGKEKTAGRAVAHAKCAGYGIPPEFLMKPEQFATFTQEVAKLGDGDLAKGFGAANKLIKAANAA